MRCVSQIIDRVVEAGICKYWISLRVHSIEFHSGKIAIVHPFYGNYSFNLCHMHPAFYLHLLGW